jgi:hypothetical protein
MINSHHLLTLCRRQYHSRAFICCAEAYNPTHDAWMEYRQDETPSLSSSSHDIHLVSWVRGMLCGLMVLWVVWVLLVVVWLMVEVMMVAILLLGGVACLGRGVVRVVIVSLFSQQGLREAE